MYNKFWGLAEKIISDNKIKPELIAPQTGEVIRVEDIKDSIFSNKLLGDGFAVKSYSNNIYSPVSGIVNQIADTLHAYGITTDDGLDILVHIGIDTMSLSGSGFKTYVREGRRVKAGTKIASADIKYIMSKGIDAVTVVLITNISDIKSWGVSYGVCEGGKTVVLKYEK